MISLELAYDLWASALNADDLTVSIAIGALALLKERGQFPGTVPFGFRIGSDFFDSIVRHQASGEQRYASLVAQICFALAANCFGGTDKPFGRLSAEVRDRDGAEGRRVHVTKAGVGLRLMYWRQGDKLEFANVGPKLELRISQGEDSSTCACRIESLYAAFGEESSIN
jgi:hypothetical protein